MARLGSEIEDDLAARQTIAKHRDVTNVGSDKLQLAFVTAQVRCIRAGTGSFIVDDENVRSGVGESACKRRADETKPPPKTARRRPRIAANASSPPWVRIASAGGCVKALPHFCGSRS